MCPKFYFIFSVDSISEFYFGQYYIKNVINYLGNFSHLGIIMLLLKNHSLYNFPLSKFMFTTL